MPNQASTNAAQFIQRNVLALVCGIAVICNAQAQEQKTSAKKSTRVVDAVCDFDSSKIAAENGNFVCQYQCRDPDRSKIYQVYYSASFKSCPSPLKAQIRQMIRDPKASGSATKNL